MTLRPADPQLRLDQFRRIEPGQLTETLMISSQLGRAIDVAVEVELSCDFARLNDDQDGPADEGPSHSRTIR